MRKVMIIGLGVLVMCPLAAPAQTQIKSKPDLSGTWEVDKAKSEKTNIPLEDSETSVVIVQHDPEIRMVRKFGSSSGDEFAMHVVYYADQRGEAYQDPSGRQTIKSKTRWDGDKLVTRYSGGRVLIGSMVNVDILEEWKLSKDGKTLTKKLITIFPKNAPNRVNAVPVASSNIEVRRVYNRISP